ncbi:DUF1217 domain-containing protein [Salinarimonas ramus]|uniref:Flagellar basal-body rod protein FlgF n=1 Tax=Salinarimonas ramus TaxID=690164 RepID=A0A917QDD2_9HYPH|nr:DUF1217 domain-containing protein [Salinarimonas ramus]GGK42787.1 hypothetical protein GCM10011322_32300 [Salinarimonas ramus]
MLATALSYRLVASDLPRTLERTAQAPQASREIAYYREKIGTVKSIEDFLADDRLFSFAMKAHGLSDMTYAKGFMRKALVEGIDSRDAFAVKLVDKRYRDFVETFNFKRHGETATIFSRAVQGTIDKYVRQTLEETQGAQNEGVRLALYFERKAPSLRNMYEILADPALAKVVRTALALPDSMAATDIDRQARLFEDRIDLADFKDPEKLNAFIERFTGLWDLANPQAPAQAPNVLIGQPVTAQIGSDLLMSLQSIRFGR